MKLNIIKPASGAHKSRKRVGRGIGSGLGKTCGRGHKGQRSRSGGFHKIGFEGGQMPLYRRLPKRGFKVLNNNTKSTLIKLSVIASLDSPTVDIDLLYKLGIVKNFSSRIKIVNDGYALSRPFEIKNIMLSRSCRSAIENAGGCVVTNTSAG